jgi:hypothetical protein
MIMVRHGVANGASRSTAGPTDDGTSCARRRWPSSRRSHIEA